MTKKGKILISLILAVMMMPIVTLSGTATNKSAEPPKILTTELPKAYCGQPYYFKLEASGSGPITWDIGSNLNSVRLPRSLTYDANTGVILGVLDKVENMPINVPVTVTAINSSGWDSKQFTLEMFPGTGIEPEHTPGAPKITTIALPNPVAGQDYSYTLNATGDEPITWAAACFFGGSPITGSANNESFFLIDTDSGVLSSNPLRKTYVSLGFHKIIVFAMNSKCMDTKTFILEVQPSDDDKILNPEIKPFQPRVWLDAIEGVFPTGDLILDEFPDTLFRYKLDTLTAIDTDGEKTLIPPWFFGVIYKLYLADLNSDGMPEFCAAINFGSGASYLKIVVYDYAAGKTYELSDRSCYEYTLSMIDGTIFATQAELNHQYHGLGLIKTGRLAIIDGELIIIPPEPIGTTITGSVRSYNPNNPTCITLTQEGKEMYKTTIEATTGFGQVEQTFAFDNVIPGTYDLKVTKQTHLDYVLTDLTVGSDDLDLTQNTDPNISIIALPCGDITGDGYINSTDLSILIQPSNYGKRVTDPGVDERADLTGVGWIDSTSLSILIQLANYNKTRVIHSYR